MATAPKDQAHTTAITKDADVAELKRKLASGEYLGDGVIYAPGSPNPFQQLTPAGEKALDQGGDVAPEVAYTTPETIVVAGGPATEAPATPPTT